MATAQNDIEHELKLALEQSENDYKREQENSVALAMALSLIPVPGEFPGEDDTELNRVLALSEAEAATADLIERLRAADEKAIKEATEQDVAMVLHMHHAYADTKNDAELARVLAEEMAPEEAGPHPLSQHLTPEQILQARNQLAPILAHPSVRGIPGVALPDAHAYTSTFIRANLPILRAIDDALRPGNPSLLPAQILAELKQHCHVTPTELMNIELTMKLLNEFLALGNPIEAVETHTNVPELLSRTWTLARQFGARSHETMGAVASVLSDNIGDAGGCMAGLVARLYACYANMLNYILPPRTNTLRPTSS